MPGADSVTRARSKPSTVVVSGVYDDGMREQVMAACVDGE